MAIVMIAKVEVVEGREAAEAGGADGAVVMVIPGEEAALAGDLFAALFACRFPASAVALGLGVARAREAGRPGVRYAFSLLAGVPVALVALGVVEEVPVVAAVRAEEAVGRVEEVTVEAVVVAEVVVGEVAVVVAALPNRAASAGRILACAQRRMMYSRTEILCG